MQTINVVIRRHLTTGELELFFANDFGKQFPRNPSWWIECFNPNEGHSEVSRHYMTQQCGKPLPADDPQAIKLARTWGNYGPDKYRTRIVKALRGPKGYTYGGE